MKPAYRDLLAVPGATTSSTGLAFLLATIGRYGDRWPDYWTALLANGATVTDGWSQAYETDFTQGGGHGHLPIVVSYDSSPAFTVPKGATSSTTKALLDTCFRQVEYAGVLAGRAEREGRRGVRRLPAQPRGAAGPARRDVRLPGAQRHAAAARPGRGTPYSRPHPLTVSPADITAHRDEWLRQWSDLVSR